MLYKKQLVTCTGDMRGITLLDEALGDQKNNEDMIEENSGVLVVLIESMLKRDDKWY